MEALKINPLEPTSQSDPVQSQGIAPPNTTITNIAPSQTTSPTPEQPTRLKRKPTNQATTASPIIKWACNKCGRAYSKKGKGAKDMVECHNCNKVFCQLKSCCGIAKTHMQVLAEKLPHALWTCSKQCYNHYEQQHDPNTVDNLLTPLKQTVAKLEAALQSKEAEASHFQHTLKKHKTTITEVTSQNQGLQNLATINQNTIAQLNTKLLENNKETIAIVNSNNTSILKLKDELAKVNQANQNITKQASATPQNKQLQNTLKQQKNTIDELQEKHTRNSNSINDLHHELEKKTHTLSTMSTQHKTATQHLADKIQQQQLIIEKLRATTSQQISPSANKDNPSNHSIPPIQDNSQNDNEQPQSGSTTPNTQQNPSFSSKNSTNTQAHQEKQQPSTSRAQQPKQSAAQQFHCSSSSNISDPPASHQVTRTLSVDSRVIGRIIGKYACKIKALCDTYQVTTDFPQISAPADPQDNAMQDIKIKGTEQNTNLACKTILQSIICKFYPQCNNTNCRFTHKTLPKNGQGCHPQKSRLHQQHQRMTAPTHQESQTTNTKETTTYKPSNQTQPQSQPGIPPTQPSPSQLTNPPTPPPPPENDPNPSLNISLPQLKQLIKEILQETLNQNKEL